MPLVTSHSPTPPAVRVLPLNRGEEFKDCDSAKDVQQKYFLDQLPLGQNGCYFYKERGLRADRGTVVLFQCDNRIIASAEFLRAKPFKKPHAEGYKGVSTFMWTRSGYSTR